MSQRRPANQTPVIVLALVCRSLVLLIFKIDKNVDKKGTFYVVYLKWRLKGRMEDQVT